MASTGRNIVALPLVAAGLAMATPSLARDAGPAYIPVGDVADAPFGFVEMCARDTALCMAGIGASATSTIATPPAPVVRMPIGNAISCQPKARTLSFTGASAQTWFQPIFAATFNGFGRTPQFGSSADQTQNCEAGLGRSSFAATALATASPTALPASTQTRTVWEPQASPTIARMNEAEEIAFIKSINKDVNRAISPVADYLSAGTDERWDRPGRGKYLVGDCEDYAIEKRMRLIEAGFAPSKLSYAAAFVKGYGMHIVLIARLQNGDVVLDNISPHVLPWSKVRYSWLRVQSTQDPKVWFRVGAPSSSGQLVNAAPEPRADAQS